jgi:hypothetical protein
MKTYLTIYQNEQRAAELEIRDQNDAQYVPSSVYATIVDDSAAIVLQETPALIINNTASILIPSSISSTIGEYEIIWRILKVSGDNTYTYYHKTQLVIEEL